MRTDKGEEVASSTDTPKVNYRCEDKKMSLFHAKIDNLKELHINKGNYC